MTHLVVQALANHAPAYGLIRSYLAFGSTAVEVAVGSLMKKSQGLKQDSYKTKLNAIKTFHVITSLTSISYFNSKIVAVPVSIVMFLLTRPKVQLYIDLYTGARKIETLDQVQEGKTSCTPIINIAIATLNMGAKAIDLVAIPFAVSRIFQGEKTRILAGGITAIGLAQLYIWDYFVQSDAKQSRSY